MVLFLSSGASAAGPVAGFTAVTATTGTAPLTVSFADQSTGSPTGWGWYFGDESYTNPWTLVCATAPWGDRYGHSSVAMPDGSIVLTGGSIGNVMPDVWRSTNQGVTWTRVNASAWNARQGHTSVVMPDGSIILVAGASDFTLWSDVWRSTDNGNMWTQPNTSLYFWEPRYFHSSVATPGGSIVVMGGYSGPYLNDTWLSADNGRMWTEVSNQAPWQGRWRFSSVVSPDGTIVLMGGETYPDIWVMNDTWRSTDNGATWTLVNQKAKWPARYGHSSVIMPDGSIILTGGVAPPDGWKNDTWRSTDNGATWSLVNPSAGWSPRYAHSSVVMPDGSIVLTGGSNSSAGGGGNSEVWRFQPAGSSAQNPSHTYTQPGTYQVSLQARNAEGYTSTRKVGYITVLPPVSAAGNGTIIEQGATIFIGEQGLNVTHALNGAYYGKACGAVVTCPALNSPPPLTQIGWWPLASEIYNTAPLRIIDLKTQYSNLIVSPANFVGNTGNWYLLENGLAYKNPVEGCGCDANGCSASLVFTVAEPALDIRIIDYSTKIDVTGRSVSQGEKLGFRIDTNMYPAVNGTFRHNPLNACSPATFDPAVDGFINIRIKDEANNPITALYHNDTGKAGAGPYTVLKNFVNTQPFYWGLTNNWDTGATDTINHDLYPVGTYTVSAESTLNNMKTNYRQGGADYTGKTVSQSYTITLVNGRADDIGVYQSGQWVMDYWTNGIPDDTYYFGTASDIPLAGDFDNNGRTDIGVFRSGQWILDYGIDRTVDRRFQYGLATDKPLVGDFNNDGITDIGVFRSGQWILDYGIDRTVDHRFQYGLATDKPLVGDFNNDGITDIGVFRSGQWILDYGMDRIVDRRFGYGMPSDTPVVGNWI